MIKINFSFPKKWRFVKRNVELVGLVALGLAILIFIIIGLDTAGRFVFYRTGSGTPGPFSLKATDHYLDGINTKPLPNAFGTQTPSYTEPGATVQLNVDSNGNPINLFRIQGEVYE